MKYQSRADLLIAAGESIKMQQKHGINPVCKWCGDRNSSIASKDFTNNPEEYEFPLAVVEGKPVFAGDELYNTNTGNKLSIHQEWTTCWDYLSWNPPKTKTVMVELLREDAEWIDGKISYSFKESSEANVRVQEACRKALEKA